MSYTNVTIPDYYSYEQKLKDENLLLKTNLENEIRKREELEKILYNIPEAVKEYGYVNISNRDKSFRITLVEKQPPTNEASNE